MADTWRDVAEALAERMVHQANNCPAGSGFAPDGSRMGLGDFGDKRHVPEEHPECPFCADTVAYRRFLKKRGSR